MNEKEITALKNIVRTGKVSSTSAADRTVRVVYDGDGMVSAPLKLVKELRLPSIGEDVLCICLPNDSGDGFVIGGL